jgi:glycosyltransferase involved in cell wall biosynthesis
LNSARTSALSPTTSQTDPQSEASPVTIVMATLNGSEFIGAQIQSLLDQTYANWSLAISDDGSSDDTVQRIREFKDARIGAVMDGPKQGFARNFLTALASVPDGHAAAFCDQDDVWMPDKLERAMSHLQGIQTPALYSAGRYIAAQDLQVYATQSGQRSSHFAHLLFRNCATGNTCVLNAAAVRAVQRALPVTRIAFHDWYAAQIISGIGGKLIYDPEPVLLYRQHRNNVLGASRNRFALMADGSYAHWVQSHLRALHSASDMLTPAARLQLDRISRLTQEPLLKRLSGLYREVGHLASFGLAIRTRPWRPLAER